MVHRESLYYETIIYTELCKKREWCSEGLCLPVLEKVPEQMRADAKCICSLLYVKLSQYAFGKGNGICKFQSEEE